MAVRLPAIAPRPEPTPQERSAALLQGVISAIMQPSKVGRESSPVDQMMRTMRAQSFINDLARMQPGDDAGRAEAVRIYRTIGAIGEAAGGLPFGNRRNAVNRFPCGR
jgi:hypothetical protein